MSRKESEKLINLAFSHSAIRVVSPSRQAAARSSCYVSVALLLSPVKWAGEPVPWVGLTTASLATLLTAAQVGVSRRGQGRQTVPLWKRTRWPSSCGDGCLGEGQRGWTTQAGFSVAFGMLLSRGFDQTVGPGHPQPSSQQRWW